MADGACDDAAGVNDRNRYKTGHIEQVEASVDGESADGRHLCKAGLNLVVDAAVSVTDFDAENEVGLDLFRVEVAGEACDHSSRRDDRHLGKLGQDLFEHVAALELFFDAARMELEADYNRFYSWAS